MYHLATYQSIDVFIQVSCFYLWWVNTAPASSRLRLSLVMTDLARNTYLCNCFVHLVFLWHQTFLEGREYMRFAQFYLFTSWDGHGLTCLNISLVSRDRFLSGEWRNKWASPSSHGAVKERGLQQSEKRWCHWKNKPETPHGIFQSPNYCELPWKHGLTQGWKCR